MVFGGFIFFNDTSWIPESNTKQCLIRENCLVLFDIGMWGLADSRNPRKLGAHKY